MMMLVERPQVPQPVEEKKAVKHDCYEGLKRLPVYLFGKLPVGYKEDPLDPAGTAD